LGARAGCRSDVLTLHGIASAGRRHPVLAVGRHVRGAAPRPWRVGRLPQRRSHVAWHCVPGMRHPVLAAATPRPGCRASPVARGPAAGAAFSRCMALRPEDAAPGPGGRDAALGTHRLSWARDPALERHSHVAWHCVRGTRHPVLAVAPPPVLRGRASAPGARSGSRSGGRTLHGSDHGKRRNLSWPLRCHRPRGFPVSPVGEPTAGAALSRCMALRSGNAGPDPGGRAAIALGASALPTARDPVAGAVVTPEGGDTGAAEDRLGVGAAAAAAPRVMVRLINTATPGASPKPAACLAARVPGSRAPDRPPAA